MTDGPWSVAMVHRAYGRADVGVQACPKARTAKRRGAVLSAGMLLRVFPAGRLWLLL
ncbi:hypothetical protein LK537_24575 [Lachnoclostridium pacaense]|uniref:Uncharacterized protein n=1 Tax=Enterocloster hominis (ex Hitch et al. 2024) TaxID=1917870 RepID=A0ABV1DCL9_9FIRM|nr:hypothetical protein [Lachnoclostridium pacaense]MCC2820484.1 hypothetical protein [Lachnoclostridium pacaense]